MRVFWGVEGIIWEMVFEMEKARARRRVLENLDTTVIYRMLLQYLQRTIYYSYHYPLL